MNLPVLLDIICRLRDGGIVGGLQFYGASSKGDELHVDVRASWEEDEALLRHLMGDQQSVTIVVHAYDYDFKPIGRPVGEDE